MSNRKSKETRIRRFKNLQQFMSNIENGVEGKWVLELCEFRQFAHPEVGVCFLKNE